MKSQKDDIMSDAATIYDSDLQVGAEPRVPITKFMSLCRIAFVRSAETDKKACPRLRELIPAVIKAGSRNLEQTFFVNSVHSMQPGSHPLWYADNAKTRHWRSQFQGAKEGRQNGTRGYFRLVYPPNWRIISPGNLMNAHLQFSQRLAEIYITTYKPY